MNMTTKNPLLPKKQIEEIFGNRAVFDISAKKLTTFKTGGFVKVVVFPFSEEEIDFLFQLSKKGICIRFIGCGSNILVSDHGFDGIIAVTRNFSDIRYSEDLLHVSSGTKLSNLLGFCVENSIGGLEFLAGIPGTAGGAVIANAGTNNRSISDVIYSIRFLDVNGLWCEKKRNEIDWGYRYSDLKRYAFFVEFIRIIVEKGDDKTIKEKIKFLMKKRMQNQPLKYASAGCVFKNPSGCFAGMLIENAGMKGFRLGGAEVSDKHANFIVNAGGANSLDIWKLIVHIKNTVKKKYNIELEPEIEFIGRFP